MINGCSKLHMEKFSKNSFEYIKQQIKNHNAADVIEDISLQMKEEESPDRKIILAINSVIAKLSLQTLRSAINDCNRVLSYGPSPILYFLRGLAFLWMENEKDAINSWVEGAKIGGPVSYFSVMSRLIVDPNARSFFYSKRFDIVEILDFVENFDKTRVFSNSDTHYAYSELRKNALNDAIAHFSLIIANDPNNIEALKGRGTAECFSGQWKKAIDDFTIVITKNADVETCSKFRAVSYAAIGNYTAAIADFSTAIALGPFDFITIAERGRLHMLRKCYNLALNDFKQNPQPFYDDKFIVNMAECYYAIGDLSSAHEMIRKVNSDTDHRKEYCHYLICRDLRLIDEAFSHLLRANELLPSFFLQRTAADFMYDSGRFIDAVKYYKGALKLKEEDADTQRKYALSLFQSGAEMQGVEILKALHEAWVTQQNEIDFGQDTFDGLVISGHLKNFYQTSPNKSVLNAASDDLYFISNMMNNSKQPISTIVRQDPLIMKSLVNNYKPPVTEADTTPENENGNSNENENEDNSEHNDFDGIKDVFHLFKFEPSPEEIKLIQDADRIGARIQTEELETTPNKRAVRCYGLCVLYLAQKFREIYYSNKKKKENQQTNPPAPTPTQISNNSTGNILKDAEIKPKEEPYWRDVIGIIIPILTLIDLSKDVRWTLDTTKGILHSEIAPTYYLQRGERVSPKYRHAFPYVMRQFDSQLTNSFADIVQVERVEDVYSITQEENTIVNSTFQCKEKTLKGPTICLKYLGTHGFDLFIRPPLDLNVMRKYEKLIQLSFAEIINENETKGFTSLSTLVLLIWLYQPFSHYSVELGHIIYHAFILGFCSYETKKIVNYSYNLEQNEINGNVNVNFADGDDEGGANEVQLFIELMAMPNENELGKILISNFREKKIQPSFAETSLSFWDNEPSLEKLYPLLDYEISE